MLCFAHYSAIARQELFIIASEGRNSQRWLIIISVRESPHVLVLALATYVRRWRVGANGKNSSGTVGARDPLGPSLLFPIMHQRVAGRTTIDLAFGIE